MPTSFPAANYMNDNARTEGQMKQAFEDILIAGKRMPGGIAETDVTLTSATPALAGIPAVKFTPNASNNTIDRLPTTDYIDGSVLMVRTSTQMNIKHNISGDGKIVLASGVDPSTAALPGLTLWSDSDYVLLMLDNGVWYEISRSNQRRWFARYYFNASDGALDSGLSTNSAIPWTTGNSNEEDNWKSIASSNALVTKPTGTANKLFPPTLREQGLSSDTIMPTRVRLSWSISLPADTTGTYRSVEVEVTNSSNNANLINQSRLWGGVAHKVAVAPNAATATLSGSTRWFQTSDNDSYQLVFKHDATTGGGCVVHDSNTYYADHFMIEVDYSS